MKSLDERINYIYELGKIHPLTYKHVLLMDDGFKLRFLKVKEEILNELLSDPQQHNNKGSWA